MCTTHELGAPGVVKVSDALEREFWRAVSHHVGAKTNLGPLQAQKVLLTTTQSSQARVHELLIFFPRTTDSLSCFLKRQCVFRWTHIE